MSRTSNCVICTKRTFPSTGTFKEQLVVIYFVKKLFKYSLLCEQDDEDALLQSFLEKKGNPVNWIWFCQKCFKNVEKAQKLYSWIAGLEIKLENLRNEVETEVLRSAEKSSALRSVSTSEEDLYNIFRGTIVSHKNQRGRKACNSESVEDAELNKLNGGVDIKLELMDEQEEDVEALVFPYSIEVSDCLINPFGRDDNEMEHPTEFDGMEDAEWDEENPTAPPTITSESVVFSPKVTKPGGSRKSPAELRTCPICLELFDKPSLMKRHVDVKHSQRPAWKCDDCGGEYTRSDTLRLHQTHHCPASATTARKYMQDSDYSVEELASDIHDNNGTNVETVDEQLEDIDDVNVIQSMGNFDKAQGLQNNEQTESQSGIRKPGPRKTPVELRTCPVCNMIFDRPSFMTKHLKSRHGNKKSPIELKRNSSGKFCSKSDGSAVEQKPFLNDEKTNDDNFDEPKVLNRCIVKRGSFVCDVCRMKFVRRDFFNAHKRIHTHAIKIEVSDGEDSGGAKQTYSGHNHGADNEDAEVESYNEFDADESVDPNFSDGSSSHGESVESCDPDFEIGSRNRKKKSKPIPKIAELLKSETDISNCLVENDAIPCLTSSSKTPGPRKSSLELRTCPVCEQVFDKPSRMTRHLYAKHTKTNPVQCDGCGKEYCWADSLRIHKKKYCPARNTPEEGNTGHQQEDLKLHSTSDCKDDDIQQKDTTKNSSQGKSGRGPKKSSLERRTCPVCKEVFEKPSRLIRHFESKHRKMYLVKCDACGKGYNRPDSLIIHQKYYCSVNKAKEEGIIVPQQDSESNTPDADDEVSEQKLNSQSHPESQPRSLGDNNTDGKTSDVTFIAKDDHNFEFLGSSMSKEIAQNDHSHVELEEDHAEKPESNTKHEGEVSVETGEQELDSSTSVDQTEKRRSRRFIEKKLDRQKADPEVISDAQDTDDSDFCVSSSSSEQDSDDSDYEFGHKTRSSLKSRKTTPNLSNSYKKSSSRKAPLEDRKCPVCNLIFSKPSLMKTHLSLKHDRKLSFFCDQCPRGFVKKEYLSYHLATHSRKQNVETPDWMEDRTCPICKCVFSRPSQMTKHVNAVHEKNVPCYTCDVCSREFAKKGDMIDHKLTHLSEEEKLEIAKTQKDRACPVCYLVFSKPSVMLAHLNVKHERKLLHFCDQCPKGFLLKTYLKDHKLSHLSKEERIKAEKDKQIDPEKKAAAHLAARTCPVCNKLFKKPSRMREHLEGLHKRSKTFMCEKCGKEFKWKDALSKHLKYHENGDVMPRPFPCTYEGCGKFFICKRDVRDHLKTHTGRKDFYCSICNKSFAHKMSFKRHNLLTHEGDVSKDFKCDLCGKAFLFRYHLNQHLRGKSHGGIGHTHTSGKRKSRKNNLEHSFQVDAVPEANTSSLDTNDGSYVEDVERNELQIPHVNASYLDHQGLRFPSAFNYVPYSQPQ